VALALCAVSAGAGFIAYRHVAATHELPAPSADEIRPDLVFHDLDGHAHRLSEWNGKLLLLNFWATWCGPCIKEIPLLVEAQKESGARGFQVVGVAMDETAAVTEFQARMHMNYPTMIGASDVMSAMDQLGNTLGALPFSVLIAPDGRILARTAGALEKAELETWAKDHLPP
jgi:thiol-disulfide isomerase/thioredoxin